MQYLVLLSGDESKNAAPGTPEFDVEMAGYLAFGELAGEAIVDGNALWGNDSCRTVRHDGGKVSVTNGPFAETIEGVGGYYVLEAPTLDDVIELVRHIPATATGASEIRPMVQHFDETADRGPLLEGQVRYFATIHGPTSQADDPSSPQWAKMGEEHGKFAANDSESVVGGGAVQPASTATTVQVRDGELLVTDGPYTEVAEVVGGYYVLRATADVAAEVAGRIPVNEGGAIQLRRIMEIDA
jgi:hypothetical protein